MSGGKDLKVSLLKAISTMRIACCSTMRIALWSSSGRSGVHWSSSDAVVRSNSAVELRRRLLHHAGEKVPKCPF